MRHVPPAGARLQLSTIWRAFGRAGQSGADNCGLRAISDLVGARYVFGAISGRAGIALTLRALRSLRPERDVVAAPAYTCYSLAAAVVRSGLKFWPLDVDPQTLTVRAESFDALPADRVLCLVAAHLFGFLDDAETFRKAARQKGAFVLDDAAQALGGRRSGVPAGMAGDVGVYSLGRGKALPLGEGGVAVTNDPVVSGALRNQMENLPEADTSPVAGGIKLAATSVLLSPQLYWMPNALPFLKLGITEFDPSFPIARLSRLTAAMLAETLGWVANLNRVRTDNARQISAALAGMDTFTVLQPASDCDPTYIRLPALAASRDLRDGGVAALRAAGIGATAMYPGAICDLEALQPHRLGGHCAGAEELAARLLTLPTNPLLRRRDITTIADTLGSFRV